MDVRVRLRPWLESRLDEGWIDGLKWIDKEKGIFKIPWKHHSKHTWTESDAAIFKDWAVVTGRYREGIDHPDWPMWKTRLRCALNKAPDIQEVKQRHNLHCDEPFKVYRFISKTESLWRANATRNASMIFDGVTAIQKPFIPHISSVRVDTSSQSNPAYKRPTFLLQRLSGGDIQTRPIAVLHRRPNGLFVKPVQISPNIPVYHNQRSNTVHNIQSDSMDVGHMRESSNQDLRLFQCDTPLNLLHSQRYVNQRGNGIPTNIVRRITANAAPVQYLPNFESINQRRVEFLPDVMEPEYHQLGIRIQHLSIRVKDAIITNPNGCCIYFGRYNEINSPAAPDPVEAQIPHHVSEANKRYVDLLLDNMVRGVILSVTHGSIFAERMCKCAVFVYSPTVEGEYIFLKKLGRREREMIYDYDEFMNDLRLLRLGQRVRPNFEVILAFGQQLRPNTPTSSLLVWCRVASCRAWFQLHKDWPNYSNSNEYCTEDGLHDNSSIFPVIDLSAAANQYRLTNSVDYSDNCVNSDGFMSSNLNGYSTDGTGIKLESDDVSTMEFPDAFNPEGISSEQIIEEGVEVPLDDQDSQLVYSTSVSADHDVCPHDLESDEISVPNSVNNDDLLNNSDVDSSHLLHGADEEVLSSTLRPG